MKAIVQFRLVRFGSAKALTQAQLRTGMQESEDQSDRWGV